jgi:hypothetical protein
MVRLYTATTEERTICQTLQCRETELADISDSLRRNVEDVLDQRRPTGIPPRLSSWFACDQPHFAAKYLDAQLKYGPDRHSRNGQSRIYAVEMDAPRKQPMCLVDAVTKCLSENQDEITLMVADEYWRPTQEWRFFEYLSREMHVVAQVAWPETVDLTLALEAYSKDRETRDWFLKRLLKTDNAE